MKKKFIYRVYKAADTSFEVRISSKGTIRIFSESPVEFKERMSSKERVALGNGASVKVIPEKRSEPILPETDILPEIPAVQTETIAPKVDVEVRPVEVSQEENIEVGDKIMVDILGTPRQAKILETFELENRIKIRLTGTGEEMVAPASWFIKKL